MSILRSDIESIIIRRTGNWLAAAGLDNTTIDGTNDDLNDPLGVALRDLGYGVVSIAAVTDADVSVVSPNDTDALLDVAELRTLESILGNLDQVTFTADGSTFSDSHLADRLEKAVARKQAWVEQRYGLGMGTLRGGVVGLGFTQQNTPEFRS